MATIKDGLRISNNDTIFPVVSAYNHFILDDYNQMDIRLKGEIGVRIRVYNDGMAYRFFTTEKDADLIGSELVYRLGPELALEETSWIEPGLVAWDWWNDNNIYGVDFKAGINTATYKHYIDFAAENGIPYVTFDEGWSDPADLFKIHPGMDFTPGASNSLCTFATKVRSKCCPTARHITENSRSAPILSARCRQPGMRQWYLKPK